MESEADKGARLKARLAGLFYLGTIAAGIFAEVGARGAVRTPGDGAATAAAIQAKTGLYRMGEAADLVALACYLVVTALLYDLMARRMKVLSLTAAGFSGVGIAVLAAAGLLHLAPLALLDGGYALGAPGRDALIGLSLRLHGVLYGVSLFFFGVYCVLIGLMAIRTRLAPAAVGGLMALGGLVHVVTKLGGIAAPEAVAALPGILNLAPLLGEAALALSLIALGSWRLGKPEARAAL